MSTDIIPVIGDAETRTLRNREATIFVVAVKLIAVPVSMDRRYGVGAIRTYQGKFVEIGVARRSLTPSKAQSLGAAQYSNQCIGRSQSGVSPMSIATLRRG